MIHLSWNGRGWRVRLLKGKLIVCSFVACTYFDAFFFKKYEAEMDASFMFDYITND